MAVFTLPRMISFQPVKNSQLCCQSKRNCMEKTESESWRWL